MIRVIISLFLISTLTIPLTGNSCGSLQDNALNPTLQTDSDSSQIARLLKLCWENRNSDPESSVKYGTEAIALATRYNDYYNLSSAYGFVGVAYRVMGKYSTAVDYYYLGLDVALKNNIPEQAGYSYLNLANLYVYQELTAMAAENLKKAEIIAVSSGNKKMLAYANLYAGRILSIDGKPDSALISYNKSLLLRQELNQQAEQATCYKYIGDIYFQQGNFSKANENYELSLSKIDKLNDKDLYASLLVNKSQVLIKDNKLNQATSLANEAIGIAREIGAKKTIKDALQVQSEIAFILKDFKASSELQRKVIMYDDSLFSKQISEKIFFLEYQAERQQRDIKIDLLNKDNSIKELQLKRGKFVTIGLAIILFLLATVFMVLLIMLRQRRKHELLLESNNQQIVKQRDNIEQQNRQLTETNHKLEKSEEELKRIVQTKDKLLSIIAHDLRNPFTALIGLTDLLRQNADSIEREELNQYISMINESSHTLLQLIENLLAWARSQTGTLKPVITSLNLKNQTDEVLALYSSQAETKGIILLNEIPDNISVNADQKILATILRNLISNGIKYTRNGGRVTCSAYSENGMTVLKVQDTGIGMSENLRKNLFTIGGTSTTEGTNREAGTGLGLIICKEFTETLGGTISVDSIPGTGTTFFVTLPGTDILT